MSMKNERNESGRTMETVETERLRLRPWRDDDAPALFAYASNPNVGPHGGWKPHADLAESEEILRTLFLGKYSSWAIEDRSDGRVIGSIGFEPDTKRDGNFCMELGYALAEDMWGKGLMTEAARAASQYGFERMGLGMIAIYRDPRNHRSGRVIEKCGFVYEGILRRAHVVHDGEVRDVACYSMTRAEYEAGRSGK